jgi:hypothetical protein
MTQVRVDPTFNDRKMERTSASIISKDVLSSKKALEKILPENHPK